ncbi:carotenoid isomerooxygenase-like [Lutzomyia longipalpis]|uniref:carotenoid isomerooxygenase-like n=1 Tax=Lutzomyia longipalpis TaxID=7200 RepID=UPI002483C3B9|nr:carotenoid isomerooxygenase-like [Lutzomyia longipalpis]
MNKSHGGSQKLCEEKFYPKYDEGIWLRSCEEEILDPIEGKISGIIPLWLKGSLLRNGPGKEAFGSDHFQHLFDQSAILHRFTIESGSVRYQCRFLQTETFCRNSSSKRIIVTEFGTSGANDPCRTIFAKMASVFNLGESSSDNAVVSIYPLGDELFAFGECPAIFSIDPESLKAKERINLNEDFGIVHHTSHPHILPDGTAFNLGTIATAFGPKYCIIRFPEQRTFTDAKIVATLPVQRKLHPSYMHTFGITENFFVLVEQPWVISTCRLAKASWKNSPVVEAMKWFGGRMTKIRLLSRKSGKLHKTFYAEAFAFFHIINSFEEEDHLIIDICCYDNPDILNGLFMDSLRGMQTNPNYSSMFKSKCLRFVLPLKLDTSCKSSGSSKYRKRERTNLVTLHGSSARAWIQENGRIFCIPEELCKIPCDLPRINYEKFSGKPYRYYYALGQDFCDPGKLIKVDVKTKTWITWNEENTFPGEPVFVEAPNPTSEDDGVILSVLLWGSKQENRVGLLILCAKTFKELGRCEFSTPGPVPKCFHGWFALSEK